MSPVPSIVILCTSTSCTCVRTKLVAQRMRNQDNGFPSTQLGRQDGHANTVERAGQMREVFLGVDLGGSEIKGVALNREGHVLWNSRAPTNVAEGRDAVMSRVASLIQDGCRAVTPASVRALGV